MATLPTHPNYEIFEAVHETDSTTLYRGYDLNARQEIAIKAFHTLSDDDPRATENFWNGLDSLTQLAHPNIVKVYATDRERRWLMMELVQDNLGTRVAKKGIPANELQGILAQALQGLNYLHKKNRAHGAIHPANLLFDADQNVKLSEAILPDNADASTAIATDLTDLGLTALELLYGPKFDTKYTGESERPKASEIASDIKDELAQVIDRLNTQQQSDRFTSAEEALQALGITEQKAKQKAELVDSRTIRPGEFKLESLLEPEQLPSAMNAPVPPPTPPVTSAKDDTKTQVVVPSIPEGVSSESSNPLDDTDIDLELASGINEHLASQRSWLRNQIESPWIFYPMVLLLLIATGAVLYWPREKSPTDDNNGTGNDGTVSNKRKVELISTPPGASVLLNGKKQSGVTPLQLELEPGTYALTFTLDGYQILNDKLNIEDTNSTKPQQISFSLKPIRPEKQIVNIVTNPPDAIVRLNGKVVEGELRLQVGMYQVQVSKEGYDPEVVQLDVKESPIPLTKLIRLTPAPVAVSLETVPRGATVYLKGKSLSEKTKATLSLRPGEYRVEFRLPGYDSQEVTFKVEVGKAPDLKPIQLEPSPVPVKVLSNPQGASIEINGKAQSQKTNAELKLKPGKYIVKLSQSGYEPLVRNINVEVGTPLETERYKLKQLTGISRGLLIGIRQGTKQLPPVPFAASQIKEIACTLPHAGFNEEHVQRFTNLDTDKPPTAEPIRTAIQSLLKDNSVADTLFVALIGQVVQKQDMNDCYFCPINANLSDESTLVSLQQLMNTLKKSPARQIVVMIETGISTPPNGFQTPVWNKLSIPDTIHLLVSDKSGNRYLDPERAQSLFYKSLISAFRGDADTDKNGVVTNVELIEYVQKGTTSQVENVYQKTQSPQTFGSKKTFPLAKPNLNIRELQTALAMEKEKPEETAKILEKLSNKHPELCGVSLARMRNFLKSSRYDRMIEETNKIIKRDPTNFRAHDFQGDAWFKKKEYEMAIEYYDKAIKLNPDYAPIYNSKAISCLQRKKEGDVELAKKNFEKAIELTAVPNPQYFTNLSNVYVRQSNVRKAIEVISKGIAQKEFASLYQTRGILRMYLKEYPGAKQDLEKVIKQFKEQNSTAYYGLGVIAAVNTDHEEAIKHFTMSIYLKPNNWRAYSGRAKSYRKLGKVKEAMEDEEEVKALRNNR